MIKMNEKIKDVLINLATGITGLIPKKKNLWLFGAWQARLYADNSKYLFEYINSNHQEINAVWLTREKSVVAEVRARGYKCYTMSSLKGLWFAARAEAVFETEGDWDVSPIINKNKTKVIQLWHGIAGKAASWKDDKGNDLWSEKVAKRFQAYYWMASSDKYIDVLSGITTAPRERFYVTGYPRNDSFVTKPKNEYFEKLMVQSNQCKWIIYMPTHRNFGKETINLGEFKRADAELQKRKIMMVYKPHFHELKNLLPYEGEFHNIILAKDQKKYADVYSYLHYFDLLISDYSSVAYDFLCAKRPIVLFPYDIEHFRKADAGLFDYYEEIPAGPFCYTWDEVLENVSALLEKDSWEEKREFCRKTFHPFDDGKNSERVYLTVKNDILNR